MSKKPTATDSWIVRVRCTVEKEIVCENCTEAEARRSPFLYSVDERDDGISDYTTLSVTPNE